MKQAVLRLPALFRARSHTSSALLSVAMIPMAVIFVLVIVMFWVSLQKGAFGTPSATFTFG